VKIRKVEANDRKGEFRVVTYSGNDPVFPSAKARPRPGSADKVADAYVDRELARRLTTSVPQLDRLLDTTNTRKSINQLVSLLRILDCSVDLVVTDKETVA
jgi:hypothetical protein